MTTWRAQPSLWGIVERLLAFLSKSSKFIENIILSAALSSPSFKYIVNRCFTVRRTHSLTRPGSKQQQFLRLQNSSSSVVPFEAANSKCSVGLWRIRIVVNLHMLYCLDCFLCRILNVEMSLYLVIRILRN